LLAGVFFFVSVVLLIGICGYDWPPWMQKNPRPFASRGFLSKLNLPSTSANGVADYDDDQQHDLPNIQ
jgi:hypothetical protein